MTGFFPPQTASEPSFFTPHQVVLLRPVTMTEYQGDDARPAGTTATVEWMPNRQWMLIIDGLAVRAGAKEGVDFRFIPSAP